MEKSEMRSLVYSRSRPRRTVNWESGARHGLSGATGPSTIDVFAALRVKSNPLNALSHVIRIPSASPRVAAYASRSSMNLDAERSVVGHSSWSC